MSLTDTVQIITGAGSGLGRSSALVFGADGARVVCVDVNEAAAQETAELVQSAGGQAVAVAADVTDEDSMAGVAQRALESFGAIDGLFANAGVPGGGSATDVDLASWSRTIAVNLTGALVSARAVLPTMVETGRGSILFTASISGLKAFPNQVDYAASKGGVIAMARQMSLDYAPKNIRVNALCPGMVVTPLVQDLYSKRAEHTGVPRDEALAAMAARYPLGRTGTPEDMATMAAYLQGNQAGWITGQTFTVDGGMSA